jgi:hypothetical protein
MTVQTGEGVSNANVTTVLSTFDYAVSGLVRR